METEYEPSSFEHRANGRPIVDISDAPLPSPWTDEEFVEFANQEPLPPNQGFQLPAEEQPIEESEEYAEH